MRSFLGEVSIVFLKGSFLQAIQGMNLLQESRSYQQLQDEQLRPGSINWHSP